MRELAGEPENADEQDAARLVETFQEVEQQVKESMAYAQAVYTEQANRRRIPAPNYQPNDLVWLSTKNIRTKRASKKLNYRQIGPYRVLEAVGRRAYRLDLPMNLQIHDVIHTNLLRPAAEDPFEGQINLEPDPPRSRGGSELPDGGNLLIFDGDLHEYQLNPRGASSQSSEIPEEQGEEVEEEEPQVELAPEIQFSTRQLVPAIPLIPPQLEPEPPARVNQRLPVALWLPHEDQALEHRTNQGWTAQQTINHFGLNRTASALRNRHAELRRQRSQELAPRGGGTVMG
ncbi:hypothetical protein KC343_g8943 [Hortaea werneckii]|nr:hypothetical protein KC352_g17062 [Hortaea werneckii]KAI7561243.1 hypothetical protein KC317_g9191 [Hortaea werneckii]KAI7610242.1 hypothetical protein KC346_g8835 [Hortaea werneckii]KAI7618848.1 hypothetical protein KC343_g8943 [Hortaea werneckii]KAI7660114.1 hypothetical protein KC319_g8742 [Hortaea werneckii]